MQSTLNRLNLPAIETAARAFFEAEGGCHDWDHTERVVKLARHLAEVEGADMELVTAAALLHDIGRPEEFSSQGEVCHAEVGARLSKGILEGLGADRTFAVHVAECIRAHRFRRGPAPATPEARCLHDADKLDCLGATGIGRAFYFAREVGARLHDPYVDPSTTRSYSVDDSAYREYLIKLQHLPDRMLTQEGKRMAEGRHAFMSAFFDQLNAEFRGER